MKKLRETLVAMQQLDKNMSSLRSWLAHIETELSRPIVYDTCNDKEIQKKLNQQQASGSSGAAPPPVEWSRFNLVVNTQNQRSLVASQSTNGVNRIILKLSLMSEILKAMETFRECGG